MMSSYDYAAVASVLRRDFDEYVEDGKTEAAAVVETLAYAFADRFALESTEPFDREKFLTAAIGGIEGDPSNGLLVTDDVDEAGNIRGRLLRVRSSAWRVP